jgi:glycosyl hydrolase family 26
VRPHRAATVLAFAVLALAGGASSAAAAPVAVGVYLPTQWKDPHQIDAYARQVGQKPAIILTYKRWDIKPFYPPELEQIGKRGALPMVSWEPWTTDGKPAKLWAIARGRYDGYLRRSAHLAKLWGKPVMARFAQEMNGSWAPWERGGVGSTPRSFILAWRHVVSVFRQAGASNVIWVWCPNVNTGHLPFMQYYPGDSWVDWVGLDGFNWGDSIGWRPFSEIFSGSYEELARSTSKPIVIGETGSGRTGGDKAAWVTSTFLRELQNFPRVRAVVWYNSTDRADFRIASSPAALRAFRQGIAEPDYQGTRADILATPTVLHGQLKPIPIPDSGYGQPPLLERFWQKVEDRLGGAAWLFITAFGLTFCALLEIGRRRRRRRRPTFAQRIE